MVRRRKTPGAAASASVPSKPTPKRTREEFEDEESEHSSSEGSANEFQQGSSQDGLSDDEDFETDEELEEEDADPDAPRLIQWDDDDELDYEQAAEPAKAVRAKASDLVRREAYPLLQAC